jgi:hypothetical protein
LGEGKTAIALVSIDTQLTDDIFTKVKTIPQIKQVQRLSF